MPDPITEPTAAQQKEPVTNQEPTATAPVTAKPEPKTFTEDDLNRIVKERLDREKKKYADFETLKQRSAKLDEIENAKKSDEEKALAKLKALEGKIAEKEAVILKAELKDKKRVAIESAGLNLPKGVTFSDLLDMMPGGEDDIETSIQKFQKMFPQQEPPKGQGTGTQVTNTPGIGKKTLAEVKAELDAKSFNLSLTQQEREQAAKESLKIANRIMRGEV